MRIGTKTLQPGRLIEVEGIDAPREHLHPAMLQEADPVETVNPVALGRWRAAIAVMGDELFVNLHHLGDDGATDGAERTGVVHVGSAHLGWRRPEAQQVEEPLVILEQLLHDGANEREAAAKPDALRTTRSR